MMDTKKLVVGQKVWMISSEGGHYGNTGKVVEIEPDSLVVQLDLPCGFATWERGGENPDPNLPVLVRFDADGKTCDSSDVYKGPWIHCDQGIPRTDEGPWELVEETEY